VTREQVQKPAPQTAEQKQQEAVRQAEEDAVRQAQEREATDLEFTDELLDEIDSLLEENAAEFVNNYRQKGGQ
jgi:ubiquitin-like protein Pup